MAAWQRGHMRNKESLIQMTSFISLLYVEAVEKDSRRKRDMIPEIFLFHAPESDDLQLRYVDQQDTSISCKVVQLARRTTIMFELSAPRAHRKESQYGERGRGHPIRFDRASKARMQQVESLSYAHSISLNRLKATLNNFNIIGNGSDCTT